LPFKGKYILGVLSVILLHCAAGLAQKEFYTFRHMNISAGLASDIVSDIMHDGSSFINYHHDPYDTAISPIP
jgi:hypothetical protein